MKNILVRVITNAIVFGGGVIVVHALSIASSIVTKG